MISRYAPTVIGAPGGEPVPAEFAQAPTFYWSIALLDLGVIVPLTVLAASAVLRGSRTAAQGYYAVVGWFTLVPPSVAAMAAVMVARDDPYASLPTLLLLSAASLLFAAPAVAAIRAFRRSSESVITTARGTR